MLYKLETVFLFLVARFGATVVRRSLIFKARRENQSSKPSKLLSSLSLLLKEESELDELDEDDEEDDEEGSSPL